MSQAQRLTESSVRYITPFLWRLIVLGTNAFLGGRIDSGQLLLCTPQNLRLQRKKGSRITKYICQLVLSPYSW